MTLIGCFVLTVLGQPTSWMSKTIKPSTTEERKIRSEVDAMLKPGWLLPNGSFHQVAQKAYIKLTSKIDDDLLLLRATLLHVYGAYDILYRTSSYYEGVSDTLSTLWRKRRNIATFDMQRAGALFFYQEGDYFVNSDFIARLDKFKSDPFLQSERSVDECCSESNDKKFAYVAKVKDGLLKVPYCRARFVSTVVIYHTMVGAKNRDKKHIGSAVQLLRTQASSIPAGHPRFSSKEMRERANGLEKLAASWSK